MASYYRRITVLINRRAGKQDAASVQQVAETFRAAGAQVDIRMVDGSSMAAEAAAAMARGARVIVAAGGDGSVSTVASAVAGSEATLGVLPLGTLNHFAKDLGIPTDPTDAARVIAAGRSTLVDMGEVNGRPFVNNASIGMYARLISERAAMQRLGRRKWIAHGVAALQVWRRYRRMRVEVRRSEGDVRSEVELEEMEEVGSKFEVGEGGRTVVTPFVFVGNNEYELSGLELGGRKTLDGARLHVCLAPGMSRGGVARMIIAAVFGEIQTIEGFESFTTAAVELEPGSRSVQASIDGEVVALQAPLTFRSRPRALRVIVP